MIKETTNVYKHYVISPTVDEIFKEEFPVDESGISDEDKESLLEEYNEAVVNGSESLVLYSTIFKRLNSQDEVKLQQLSGNESFFETVLGWLKKFFTGIINFIKMVLGIGNKDDYSNKRKELKKLNFSNMEKGKEYKFKPNKSIYLLYPNGPKPPTNLDWVKDIAKEIEYNMSALATFFDKKIDEPFKSSMKMNLVSYQVNFETGEKTEVGSREFKIGEGKNYEEWGRGAILNIFKTNGSHLNYTLNAADDFKVNLALKSNVVPTSTEVEEITFNDSVKGDLEKLRDALERTYLSASAKGKSVDEILKEIVSLQDKYTKEVEKQKDNPEAMKAAQAQLTYWKKAFDFWRYYNEEMYRKLVTEPLRAANELLTGAHKAIKG